MKTIPIDRTTRARRTTLSLATGALLIALSVGGATTPARAADDYPTKPVRLIIPYGPGGNTDIVGRTVGQKLGERLGQPIVFDNRGGAAGTIGVGIAATSPADGYTMVLGDLGSMVIATHANKSLPYKPQSDFLPVGLVSTVSIVLTTHPAFPAKTFDEFLALARKEPGKYNYGSSGNGAPGHLAIELLKTLAKIDLVHVPYKGGAQATIGLMGEEVSVLLDGAALAQVKGGKLRALAVSGPRNPALPDVPPIADSVPGFDFTNWWGVFAPKGTPAPIVARVNKELAAVLATPEVREKLASMGLNAAASTPTELGARLAKETTKIDSIVDKAGIKFQ